MYPELLETQTPKCYWYEEDCFKNLPFHYVNAYIHNDYNFKMHAHEFYEINVIIGGSGRHYIEKNNLPAHIGDIFVIPPDIHHGYYSENSLDIFHVLLKSDFLAQYGEALTQSPGFALLFDIEPQLRQASGKKYNLHVDHNLLSTLKNELNRIQKAETEQHFVYQNALALGFVAELGILFSNTFPQPKKSLPSETDILHVMEYIKSNLDRKITLDALAAIAHMSKATLNRYFQEILQISPMRYVTECRTAKAKELLKQKKFNKTEIAQICGFFDINHLNKYL
ncbi:MAG: AraC family ligand binding domain-containing protein [Clostridia bacterium]|nr:AraC family ligand binding domain-containing protein [Clostridia bacterium]